MFLVRLVSCFYGSICRVFWDYLILYVQIQDTKYLANDC